MLNSKYKKEALSAAQDAAKVYKDIYEHVIENTQQLHEKKKYAMFVPERVDTEDECTRIGKTYEFPAFKASNPESSTSTLSAYNFPLEIEDVVLLSFTCETSSIS